MAMFHRKQPWEILDLHTMESHGFLRFIIVTVLNKQQFHMLTMFFLYEVCWRSDEMFPFFFQNIKAHRQFVLLLKSRFCRTVIGNCIPVRLKTDVLLVRWRSLSTGIVQKLLAKLFSLNRFLQFYIRTTKLWGIYLWTHSN